jgi:hypothetical protein
MTRPGSASESIRRHMDVMMRDEDAAAAIVRKELLKLEHEKKYQAGPEAAMRRVSRPGSRASMCVSPSVQPSPHAATGGGYRHSAAASSAHQQQPRTLHRVNEDLMWASIRQRALEERIQNLRIYMVEMGK